MQELAKRVVVSIVFIPFLIVALYMQGWFLFFLFLTLSVLGSQEYLAMMQKRDLRIPKQWCFLNPIFYALWVLIPGAEMGILVLAVIAAMIPQLIKWDENMSVPTMFAVVWGGLYTALLPALIVKISFELSEKKILLALILMIWTVDSIAYFVGMRFGKKRDITPVSPRKSREGFIAGLLAPPVISLIMYISGFRYFSPMELGSLAVAAGVFGQLGDLMESMLKRFCNVKDSSKLIPGHGGMLDRTDSILLAGGFLYAALAIVSAVA